MTRKDSELRPIMTRLPESLRRRLAAEAEHNGRSMNGEIIHRLERSFERQGLLREVMALAYGEKAAEALVKLHNLSRTGGVKISKGKAERVRRRFDEFVASLEKDSTDGNS